jgi:hypothetical protein
MSMTPEELEKAAIAAVTAIFAGESAMSIQDVEYPIEKLKSTGLRFVKFGEYQVLEQNKAKPSQWAKMAKAGHQVAWLFKEGKYFARIVDDEFTLLGKKREA